MKVFATACICDYGHVVSSDLEMVPAQPFCSRCGKKTFTACDQCGNRIRGRSGTMRRRTSNLMDGGRPDVFVSDMGDYSPPAFCEKCSTPLPWTRRFSEAAEEIAITLTPADAEEFRRLVDTVTRDGPGAAASATRMAQLLKNAPPALVGTLKDLGVGILANYLFRLMFPT